MRPFPLAATLLMITAVTWVTGCDGDGHSSSPATATIETIAGGTVGDGTHPTDASLSAHLVESDRDGNLYLADRGLLRRIDAATGRIDTLIGGDDVAACRRATERTCLGSVGGIALSLDGTVVVTDPFGGIVVRLVPATGTQTRLATGSLPASVATDRHGNVFFFDNDEGKIFRVDAATGAGTRFAGGDGETSAEECPLDVRATETCLGRRVRVTVDDEGGVIVNVGDALPLRRIDPTTGIISAMAVPGGDVAIGASGALVVSRASDDRVIRVDASTGATTTLFAGAPEHPRALGDPTVDPAGRVFVLADDGRRLLRLDRSGGAPTIVAGNGLAEDCGDGGPAKDACVGAMNDLDVAAKGDLVLAERSGRIRSIAAHDGTIETITDLSAQTAIPACSHPSRIAVGPTGDMFVVGSIYTVCRIDRATGDVSVVAGGSICDGLGNPLPRAGDPAVGACLSVISDVLVDADGALLLGDTYKPRLWRVDPVTGRLGIVAGTAESALCGGAGDGGDARAACVSPFRLGKDGDGNLYVLDNGALAGEGTRVRRIDRATGIITTVAGNGALGTCGDDGPAVAACLEARNLVVDPDGNLFLGTVDGVRRVDAASGVITKVAGPELGNFELSLDAADAVGRLLFFTEEAVPRVRRLTPP